VLGWRNRLDFLSLRLFRLLLGFDLITHRKNSLILIFEPIGLGRLLKLSRPIIAYLLDAMNFFMFTQMGSR
ncbi:MAG: hypothetical protein ACR2PW_04810, partial [Gammaproteobacteria bacterium]